MTFLTRRISRFQKEEDGLVMTEFLIMLPLLVWTFMALFIYWDAFKSINMAQKAAYAVSDLVSRQSDLDRDFIDGMEEVMEYLTNNAHTKMRITSVEWDETSTEYRVLFSESPGNMLPPLDDEDIEDMSDVIPTMADNESVVIVESETFYDPAFEVGIPNHTFDNFIVTRPRFYRRVCLIEDPCPPEL